MMRTLLFFISLFILLSGRCYSQSRMPEIKVAPREEGKNVSDSLNYEERPYFLLIEQSEKALAEEDYENAALRLVEAMGIEPENELNVALLSNLGMIYFYNEQDSMALVVLDKAIERSPRLIAPRQGRARILVANGRDKEAFQEYENILAIDSINTDVRFLHAMMSLYSGDLETAVKDIAVLENVIPVSNQTAVAKAILYSMTGNEIEAVSLFRKIIEIEPAPEYYSRLVDCLLALDRLGEASDTLGMWIEKYPNDAEIYYYRAILNNKRYMNEEAHRDAKRAIELGMAPEKVLRIFK